MSERGRDEELLRFLTGEIDAEAARELAGRMAEDPDLARRYATLRATWDGLELPPDPPPDPRLAARIVDRARREAPSFHSPMWVRLATGAALPLGVVIGLLLSSPSLPTTPEAPSGSSEIEALASETANATDGLAALYYELLVSADDPSGEGS